MLLEQKAQGAIIRSKIRWYDEGENPTKFFLKMMMKQII